MEISSLQLEDVTLLQVEGRIDHKNAKKFEKALKPYTNECTEGAQQKILIDFGGVDFISSAGLRALMVVMKTCDEKRVEIAVADLKPMIQEIFKISRFDLVFKIFPTVQSALEEMSPTAFSIYGNSKMG